MWLNTNQYITKKPLFVSYIKYPLILLLSLTLLISTASAIPTFSEISTPEELQNMTQYLDRDYVLTQDIDMTGFDNFEPIGNASNPFTGSLDGQNYTITGLFINRPDESYVGLFGHTDAGATIKNVGLVDINITGSHYVGGLVGYNYNGIITNSHSTGEVTGEEYAGGLVGVNTGNIENSYFTGEVTGEEYAGGLVGVNTGNIENSYFTGDVTALVYAGGLVGFNIINGIVTNSHSTGDVTGGNEVGGLVGCNRGAITDSYSTGNVTGSMGVGGLVGTLRSASITNSYSIGEVTGVSNVGGLVGFNYSGTITESYWNHETSSQSESAGGEGKTILEMKNSSIYNDWDFTNIWNIHIAVNDGYPYLISHFDSYTIFEDGDGSSNNPYQISNVIQLQAVELNLSANYTLINDIDASETVNWNDGAGFAPIANASGGMFSGSFDGNKYHVNDLFMNRSSKDIVGLFEELGPNSVIKNVRVHGNVTGGREVVGILASLNSGTIINSHSSGHVYGEYYIGGLVGYNRGTIENSSSSATVEGLRYIGGLVGLNDGTIAESFSSGDVVGFDGVGGLVGYEGSVKTIINSYSTSIVTGNDSVGGLVGILAGGSIIDSYSIGEVIGVSNVGGLVGSNYSGTITESYWDAETSGLNNSDGGESRTTAQLKQQSTFIGWDFTDIWGIHSGINNGYPYLQSLYDSYTIVEDDDVPQSSRSSRQQNIADSKSPSENIDTLFSNRQNVGAGSKVEYHVTAEDIPVTLISFDSKTNEGIVESRINFLNNVPEGTPSQNAPVYKLMEINVGRTGTIGSHNADNIFIHFKVDKKWVEENNIIPESIRMERLNNGGWERLPTERLDEDEEFFYFVAQTSGFSIFSIAGDEWTGVEEPNTVESVEVQPIDIVEDENKSNLYLMVDILIVSIVAIGFVIYKRKDSGLK